MGETRARWIFDAYSFAVTHLLIKGLVYENDPHETLMFASLIWGVGVFGTKAVGGYGPNTLRPSLTFGSEFSSSKSSETIDSQVRIEPLDSANAFVGRQRELAELRAGLDDVKAGHGRLFLLSGEPGISKTRLADEFGRHAATQGLRVVWR